MRISDWSSDVCSSDLLSDRLSRRDGMTEAWLIEEAARRGDLSTTLSHFDALFRTMPTASARFMQQMGLALGDPKFRKAMIRSDEHTSELQSLMRNSYAVFCLDKKKLSNLSLNTLI